MGAAGAELGRLYEEIRLEQMGGFAQMAQWSGGRIYPTAQAEGTFVRFLSRAAGLAARRAGGGRGRLGHQPGRGVGRRPAPERAGQPGHGQGAANALADGPVDEVTRWMPRPVTDDACREFTCNKAAHPNTVPGEPQELWLEMALARR